MIWESFIANELQGDGEHNELVRSLNHQMFIVAYAKMKNKYDALDVVQDSWVKILRKIDTLQDRDKLFEWAKAIVANTAINSLKHRSVKNEALIWSDLLEQTYPMNDKQMDDLIILNEIYENMRSFDHESRRILIYKFYYGYKDQCIADCLQLPLGTVKARIHRKIKRMREDYTL